MTIYQLNVTALSPLHIGDGQVLRQDFDFAVSGGHTYRLHVDAILEDKGEAALARGRVPPPGRLLEAGDFRAAKYFRYRLEGEPRSEKTFTELHTCLKDARDRPYIPGSSLKGALRTSLAWAAWEELGLSWRADRLGKSAKFAAQPLEKQIFGRDPNHDLLRALRVSDLYGPQKPGQGLLLVNAQVLTQGGRGSPVELEAIASNLTFGGTLTIDDHLFSDQAARLGFAEKRPWLDGLSERVRQHSRQRLADLLAWFQGVQDAERIVAFLRQLLQLSEQHAFLQLGWGGGWDSKTFGSRLKEDPGQFEALVSNRRYRLQAVRGRQKPPRKAGDPFPESRKAILDNKTEKPHGPLGWVLLEMNQL